MCYAVYAYRYNMYVYSFVVYLIECVKKTGYAHPAGCCWHLLALAHLMYSHILVPLILMLGRDIHKVIQCLLLALILLHTIV